jgi:integrase
VAGNRLHDERLPRGVSKVRRNSGVAYEARYTDPNGKQKQRTFRTKTEARQFIEGTRTKVREGTYVDPKPARTLLGDVAASYFTAKETSLRPTTIALNKSLYRAHVEKAFAGRHLNTIHLDDVQRWSNKLAATHAPGTVHAAVNLLKRILAHAVDCGLIQANPAARTTLPRRDDAERAYLTPQQVSALADAVPARYKAMILMAAYTGMRWGELAGLRTDRLNLLKRQVQVSEILVEVDGHHSFGPPKTKESRRTIALNAKLVEALAKHLALFPSNVHV